MRRITKLLLLLMVVFAPLLSTNKASAQARDTVANLRTRYNTAKNAAKPQGELKQKLDEIDAKIAQAARLGRTGELRRLYAQGTAISQGRAWTPEIEFANSLALRTPRIFVDPSKPVSLRLEQIYVPTIELAEPLNLRVSLNKPAAGARGGGAQSAQKLKDAGVFTNVSRDLIDNPFGFDLDLSGIPEGRTSVAVEVLEGSRSLGSATLNMEIYKGVDERLQRLESDAHQLKGVDALRAEILYPTDYIRNVNQGKITVGAFDVNKELAAAEAALASAKSGRDPFAGKTGDFKRHYLLTEAGEILPYRVYVPTTYKGERTYPLIIALHGNGLTENYFFDNVNGELTKGAEARGYIVAAPLGFRVDGGYGFNNNARPAEDLPKLDFSEKDVMHVLDLMKRDYKIDENRIYVIGHSMGGSGSFYLGSHYPQIWAAIASFSGSGTPELEQTMRRLPQLVVHGDADTTAPVERSRNMVAEIKRLGIDHQYIEVPGGTHGGVVAPNIRAMFDFLDQHRKPGNK
jgi:poly(3-hydroxybutyrate) depolymerase